jgi:hypothetical protein
VQEPGPCLSLTLLPRFADIPWYLRQNGGTAMVGLLFGALTVETRRPECVLGIVGIVVVLSLLTVLSSTHSASSCSKVAFCIVFGRKLIVACSCLAVGALLAWLAGNDERKAAAFSPNLVGIVCSSTCIEVTCAAAIMDRVIRLLRSV